MSFNFRRVVTGHDDRGNAVVKLDSLVDSEPRAPGYEARVVWCTSQFPPSNQEEDFDDGAPGPRGTRVLFRIGEFTPADFVGPSMHRTETLDVGLVLSGQLDMVLDGGEVIESLGPGDFVIQRGTMHSWVPRGAEPVRILFVLMDSEPVRVGERTLGNDLSVFGGRLSPMPSSSTSSKGV
ncbi:mannose-6-phosphate isomerase-like protein (cupin superfamily) [Rhodococcus sp. OAS809]|uniref:cupin domain-containing protein n=1 Tax=Rhodococcus TaxID=1827 RepID=UPI00178A5E95|nr:cupin domain-containing protein [Rhodococcus qingshengii]MDT9664877.1 cupin domain-containing protein [Rhodococcus qingshengii]